MGERGEEEDDDAAFDHPVEDGEEDEEDAILQPRSRPPSSQCEAASPSLPDVSLHEVCKRATA